jgi:hypothetical protein
MTNPKTIQKARHAMAMTSVIFMQHSRSIIDGVWTKSYLSVPER